MLKKRPLLVAALVFCLTATILIVSSTGYDPWIDYDEDGTVDYDDFISLAGEYGTSGDPTKNVSVTNWPEPRRALFPETLVLRGAYYSLYYLESFSTTDFGWREWTVLIDENVPYPPTHPLTHNYTYLGNIKYADPTDVWILGDILNFTHEVYPQAPYYIQGDVILRPTIEFYCRNDASSIGYFYFNITVYFERIDANNVPTVLAADTLKVDFAVNMASMFIQTVENMGFTFKFPDPVWIEGERLRIRFETWLLKTQSNAEAYAALWHTIETDEFIAYVPIYQP